MLLYVAMWSWAIDTSCHCIPGYDSKSPRDFLVVLTIGSTAYSA